MQINKRHFLLLEVLIAFVLIVICMIPLISPHTFILIEQKKFIQKIEVDHLVNLAYADIVERMYRNELPWNDVINGIEFDIDDFMLQRMKFDKRLPYTGTYRFEEIIHKPTEDAPRKLYLLKLYFDFIPIEKLPPNERGEIPGTLRYNYQIYAIRDLGSTGPVPEESEEETTGEPTEEEGEKAEP